MKLPENSLFAFLLAAATAMPVLQLQAVNLDMDSRWQIREFYNVVYPFGSEATMEWSGDYDSGNSGTVHEDWLEATRVRVNFFRAMGGLADNIVFDPALNAKCQDAALMISVNWPFPLDVNPHLPPVSWIEDGDDARDAAQNGNLAWGSVGADAIEGYMADTGGGNFAVGHRRWILFPQTTTMGSGDVAGDESQSILSANTLWVVNQPIGPRPETREEFIAWPPVGHVPAPLVWARWSLSYPGADFTQATVAMESNVQPIESIFINHAGSGSGFPENTIVWVPNNMDTSTRATWPIAETDETIDVTVSNVFVDGQARSFNYSVTIFDPTEAGPAEQATSLASPDKIITTAPATFSVASRPWSEGVQGRYFSATPYTTVHGAENGQNPFDVNISEGYSPIQNSRVASGSSAFHLANPDGKAQTLTLPDTFVINEGSPSLSFQSSLAWASQEQFVSVDIRLGSGNTWQSIWSQSGLVGSNSVFEPINLDLSPYIGRVIQFRLRYDLNRISHYTNTDPSVGWVIDEIALTGVSHVTDIVELPVNPGTDTIQAVFEDPGTVYMQARDIAFDGFYLDWGTVTEVVAETMTSVDVPFAQWVDDPVLGWLYGSDASWKWSLLMGYVYVDAFPWLYTSGGWVFYSRGSVYNGLWLYHAEHGFSYTQYDYGGWFQHSPFTQEPESWHNFNP